MSSCISLECGEATVIFTKFPVKAVGGTQQG